MLFTELFKGRDMCNVCGQTPCNCTHIAESADPQSRKLGRIIGHIYNEIYDMGDDALDYLNDRAAVWAQLWDRYEGDIDSIIAEEDPVTLGKAALELKDILNDLQSDQDLAEEKVRLDPKCWKGKKIGNPKTKMKGGVRVNNCVPAESVEEDMELGNYSTSDGSGTTKYNPVGDMISHTSPSFSGFSQTTDPSGKVISQNYDVGPISITKTPTGGSATYNLGDRTLSSTVKENDLAQQMLALAKKINPNARLAGTPAQERERTQQMMAQRAKDRENQPGPEPVGDEERTRLELQLKDLESKFDPDYEYSDNHSFWTKQRDLARSIASIKQRLAVKETEDHNTLSGMNDIVESLRRLREADPAYTGIDPVVRSRMGMPPATQDEIRTHLDTNPPVVRSGSGAPITTGTGSTVQSGGAVDVAKAADAASPDRAMATAKPPGTTTASVPAPSAPSAPPAPTAATKPVTPPAPAAPKPIPQVSAATTPAPSFSKGVTDIAAANKIADPNKINVGQSIKLPSGQNYTVAKGDTLSGIAAGQYKGATTPPPKPAAPAPTKPAATSAPNTTGLLGKVAPSLNLPNAGMNTPPKTATTPANTTGLLGKIAPSLNQPNAGMNTPAKTSATPTPAAPTSTPAAKNIYVPNVSGAGQKGPTVAAATGADATNPINKVPYGTGNSEPPPVMFNRMAPGTLGAVTKEGESKSERPEADYGDDYQQMVLRLKKLAGAGPLKTVYDPAKRVYKNVPTAVQPGNKK